MGLLKDMWDILKEEREVRNWLKVTAKEAYDVLKRASIHEKKTKSSQKMQTRQSTIVQLLKQPEFPKRFLNRLSYFEFLLCQIVGCVESSERGLLIRDFYLDKHILYFPMSYENKVFERTCMVSYSYSGFITQFYEIGEPDYYKFYIIDGNYDRNKYFGRIRKTLDRVVRNRRKVSEFEAFKTELDNLQLYLVPIAALYHFLEKQSFAFGQDLTDLKKAKYILSLKDPGTTRERIYEDLIYLLNFQMI